jgi:hypothetical protein
LREARILDAKAAKHLNYKIVVQNAWSYKLATIWFPALDFRFAVRTDHSEELQLSKDQRGEKYGREIHVQVPLNRRKCEQSNQLVVL